MTSGDLLLYVISAKRDMSWAVFKRTFDILASKEVAEYESAAIARSVVLKSLDGLGHCEVLSHDGNLRVVAAPSVLVRLPLKNKCGSPCRREVSRLARNSFSRCD